MEIFKLHISKSTHSPICHYYSSFERTEKFCIRRANKKVVGGSFLNKNIIVEKVHVTQLL